MTLDASKLVFVFLLSLCFATPAFAQNSDEDHSSHVSDYLPLIGTVVGGLLAVGGGFVAEHFLRSRSERKEKRDLYREQLEQIYLLSAQLVDWVGQEYTEVLQADNSKAEKDRLSNPITELKMRISFYHPKLTPYVERFDQCLDEFYNGRGVYYLHVMNDESDPPRNQVFMQHVDGPFVRLRDTQKEMVSAMQPMVLQYE